MIGDNKLVIIDEAQHLTNAGRGLKLISDHITDVQVIATGSSAFDLKNKRNEPLTGRKWEFYRYPFCFAELAANTAPITEAMKLPVRLIYGMYPEVVTQPETPQDRLKLITESYLYKDVLLWQGIKRPDKIVTLLRALALQIGNEVSYNQLSNMVGIDKLTIEKYIDILEQTYIIFKLPSYSSNQRKELKKSKK
jgi:predicted AAA+ superfamily ATPase